MRIAILLTLTIQTLAGTTRLTESARKMSL